MRTAARGGASGLLGWAEKLMQDLQLMPRQENPALAERRQARESPVLSWRVQQAVAAPPQHASNEQASPTRPPPDAASPMTEPQKPPTNGFSKVGDTASSTVIGSGASLGSSTSVGINSGSSSSTGPLRANASDLLAGVPLDAMRERQQAAQQLQRQQQQLGGGPANGPTPTSAAAPPPGTNGSLWGSTTGPAAAPAPAQPPLAADSGSLRAELSPVTSPEAAVAFAAYEQAVGSRRLVPVRLTLQLQAAEGQRLKVVGGHKSLGEAPHGPLGPSCCCPAACLLRAIVHAGCVRQVHGFGRTLAGGCVGQQRACLPAARPGCTASEHGMAGVSALIVPGPSACPPACPARLPARLLLPACPASALPGGLQASGRWMRRWRCGALRGTPGRPRCSCLQVGGGGRCEL